MRGKEQGTEFLRFGSGASTIPEVAVLMAAYNGEQFICEQIESILQQQNVSITLFISLDFSSDSTLDIINKYAKENNNIILLPYGERYGSAAQNFFRLIKEINFEKFKYVSLSDQDDIWEPQKTHEAIKVLQEKNKNAYSSNALAFWPDGRTKLLKKNQPFRKWDYLFESAGPGCSYVFEKRLAVDLKKILLSDRETSKLALHDWFIYAFARVQGYKWVIDSRSFLKYRQHESNVIGANNGLKSALQRYRLLKTGWYKAQTALLVQVLDINSFEGRFDNYFFLLKNVNELRRKKLDRISLAIFFLLRLY